MAWRAAKSTRMREKLHAKVCALEDVAISLRTVMKHGEFEAKQLEMRVKKAARRRPSAENTPEE